MPHGPGEVNHGPSQSGCLRELRVLRGSLHQVHAPCLLWLRLRCAGLSVVTFMIVGHRRRIRAQHSSIPTFQYSTFRDPFWDLASDAFKRPTMNLSISRYLGLDLRRQASWHEDGIMSITFATRTGWRSTLCWIAALARLWVSRSRRGGHGPGERLPRPAQARRGGGQALRRWCGALRRRGDRRIRRGALRGAHPRTVGDAVRRFLRAGN